MQVLVLYFASCPNWPEAGRRVRHALDQVGHPETAVTFVPVETDAEAAALGLRGSPTITVDGEDLFPAVLPPAGLSCRIYPTTSGPAGVPDLPDLIAALRERARR
ncbi:thioredoxin family protein [Phytohabitans rumicis]|uniref:thioredoxin family protein n=1 Tax=Phytohabitans rumicis TaxID=1076125 RepID=UPI0015631D24